MVEQAHVIDIHNIKKRFGNTQVLRGLSLHVAEGEVFGLIGPSGSGKSTTIHLCCGHMRPSEGSITVLGEQPTQFTRTTRHRIGYMPQQFVLYKDLTIEQNVSFVAGLYGLSEWRSKRQIQSVLELTELWEARTRVTRAASGGMQRRIALAAALVHNPDLLFADEPTANLDPILRIKLWGHFRERCTQGHTMLITTQYIDEAEYCDRVGLMFDGMLIAVGDPEQLRRQAFGGDIIDVMVESASPQYVETISALTGVHKTEASQDRTLRVVVAEADSTLPLLVSALAQSGAAVRSVGQYRPTFDEVFIRLIEQHSGTRPALGRLRTSAADPE